jgi:thiosulfate/3-mercaptopyruvate sulfurtransferase
VFPIRNVFAATLLLQVAASTPVLAGLTDYFVDTAWLESNLDTVRVVDVRGAPLYLLGHVEGAVSITKGEFLEKRRGVKSLVPQVADFESLMDRYGITPDTTVIAYAEDKNPYSARFVWTLRFHGHDRAFVLDGGYEEWAKENRPTSLFPPSIVATQGYKCSRTSDIRAEADYVLSRLGNPSVTVWDTRRRAEYEGSEVRADRGGHIPGVVHLDWTELQERVDGVLVLKNENDLRSMLTAKGILPGAEIIPHCQTGIRSSYATLVLLGLGYGNVRNYDGSWIEWANDPFFPVETELEFSAVH